MAVVGEEVVETFQRDGVNVIRDALDGLYRSEYKENRAKLALYLMMISPDYAIFK